MERKLHKARPHFPKFLTLNQRQRTIITMSQEYSKSKEAEEEALRNRNTGESTEEAPPPPYSEVDPKLQEQYGQTPSQPGYAPQNNYGYSTPPQNVMEDPNVLKVKPQLVNISQANPEHLNPAYPEFQAREAQRMQQGDYPKPRSYFKHGAPLSQGHVHPENKTGGGSFPGSSNASYHNAANR